MCKLSINNGFATSFSGKGISCPLPGKVEPLRGFGRKIILTSLRYFSSKNLALRAGHEPFAA
jgi:hypothetical protein